MAQRLHQYTSKIIRTATMKDIIQYKRGKKDVDPEKYLLCQCGCGNYWVPSKKNYYRGLSTSCGKHSNDSRIIDEVGNRYGELLVIGPAPTIKGEHRKCWLCRCSCGNEIIVRGKDLRDGQTSCGCVKSKGAKRINELLASGGIEAKSEYKFSDFLSEKGAPYRFDWGIIKDGKLFCLLEYDGEQHFDKTNAWYREGIDEIKNNYCQEKNIPLYRISYKDYSNLSLDYLKTLIHYEEENNNV